MRDRRFVAVHRGGPLDKEKHRLLAVWAADCAEHLLPIFERYGRDERLNRAIETGRAWARGEVPVGAAQKAALACHAAARAAANPVATAIARATGHAVATAHSADHSLGVAIYAAKAFTADPERAKAEKDWQLKRLPPSVRELVVTALEIRLRKKQPHST